MTRIFSSKARPRQGGFSLVELMVAVTIGLLIMVAVLQLFVDVSRTNTEMAKTNAQMENGRFAIQVIARDLQHGGFWDGFIPQFDDLTSKDIPGDYPTAVPDPCADFSTWDLAYRNAVLGIPVQVYPASAVPAGCAGLTDLQANTDILVVRHAATTATASADFDADDVYFQPSFCSSSSYDYWLTRKAAFADFDWEKRGPTGCASPGVLADIRLYVNHIYYIRSWSVTAGDGIPTLMRAEFGNGVMQASVPLVDGIEGMIVELGIDNRSDTGAAVDYTAAVNWADPDNKDSPTNRGDGAPDEFNRCTSSQPCGVDQLANVVAVKIYLLVRAPEASSGYTDGKSYTLGGSGVKDAAGASVSPYSYTPSGTAQRYQRHVYSTMVRLNNVSARRETP